AVMRRPSSPYVHAWYGHWSVSRRPAPSQTSEPRWRQTLRNARSTSSRSRTITIGTSPTVVAKKDVGSGTSPMCPTYCHDRRKMRSRSSSRTAGSEYQLQGSVLTSTALTRGTLASSASGRDACQLVVQAHEVDRAWRAQVVDDRRFV